MPVSPFDHPLLSRLVGDEEAGAFFSVEAELKEMLAFERALAEAEAEAGVISSEAVAAIATAISGFSPDTVALAQSTARDGVVVPELVKQLRAKVGPAHGDRLHFGATSQDVVDTGLAIRLNGLLDVLAARLEALVAAFDLLEARDGAKTVMAHTRMQAAIEVPAARKIASWRDPLARHLARLDGVRSDVAIMHLGGAAGTLEKLGDKGPAVRALLAARLGLRDPGGVRHSTRDGIVGLASWLATLTGSLGKFGQDAALAVQSEVGEVKLTGGGTSSAMPHKQNPVAAEVLVALARFNATLSAGMQHAMVHENERSGAAWTLEWMMLPQMAVATAAALRTAEAVVGSMSLTAEA